MSNAHAQAQVELNNIRGSMEYKRLRSNGSNPDRLAALNDRILQLQKIVNVPTGAVAKATPNASPKASLKASPKARAAVVKGTPKASPKTAAKPARVVTNVTIKKQNSPPSPPSPPPSSPVSMDLTESAFLERESIDNINTTLVESDQTSTDVDDVEDLDDIESGLPVGRDRQRTLEALEAELEDLEDDLE